MQRRALFGFRLKVKIMSKKIAVFTDSFVPGVGGTENAVLRYATELAKDNQVLVVAPFFKKGFDDGQFPFKVIRTKSLKVSKNDRWTLPAVNGWVIKKIREFAPDVLHCQTVGTTCGLANIYAKKYGTPLVYTVHTKFRYCYKHVLKSDLLADTVVKTVFKRLTPANKVFSVSDSMAAEVGNYGYKGGVGVVRNGAETVDCPVIEKKPTGVFKFIYVGLVIDYKNIEFSLRSLAIVKSKGYDFEFYIVGGGPQVGFFKKRCKQLDLEKEVRFIGIVNDKDKLFDLYAQSDLMLFPSVFDSDGLVKNEAAQASTPVLLLQDTGAAENVTDGVNGFLSQPTVEDYAHKIIELMGRRDTLWQVGARARNLFLPWHNTVEEYETVYNELLNDKK